MKRHGSHCALIWAVFVSFCIVLPAFSAEPASIVSDQESFARQAEVPVNAQIVEINHYQGSLTVIGWDKPGILIEGIKRARAETVEYARQIMQNIQIQAFERVPRRLVLEYDGPPIEWRVSREDAGIDYTAHVPRHLALDIKLFIGSVTVSDMDNRVSIDHRAGDVKVESIGGKVQIRSQGGMLSARLVDDVLKLDTQDCKLDVQDINGDIAIRHKNGDMSIHRINGQVILNSLKSNISMDQIKGRLDIDHRDGDIVAERFFDAVRLYLHKGTARLSPQVPVNQNYYCAVDNGDVILRIPESSSVLAEIEAESGQILSDFYMPISSDRGVSYCKGAVNGGRNVVQLSVKNGSASLLQSLPGVDEKFNMETRGSAPASSAFDSGTSARSAPAGSTADIKPVQLP